MPIQITPEHFSGGQHIVPNGDGQDLASILMQQAQKAPVRAASTANVADLTAVSTAMDGVTLVKGDRVLLKNQSTASQNGIYTVGLVASALAPFTRATDADVSAEVMSGLVVVVSEGTVNASRLYECVTANPITLGTTSLTFSTAATQASSISVADATGLLGSPASLEAALSNIDTGNGLLALAPVRRVRGVVTTNQAALATFTVANDGNTYVAGDRVLLAGQSTGAENGIYVVGTVGGGTAPLTRAADMAAASILPAGTMVIASAGTAGANTLWEVTTAAVITVATTATTWVKVAQAVGVDQTLVKNVADGAVLGGVEVTFVIAVADGATADQDITVTNKTEITFIEVQKGASAGGANDKITVKNGATAITDAMDINVSGKVIVRPATMDPAQTVISAGGTLRVTRTKASAANVACRVIVRGVSRA